MPDNQPFPVCIRGVTYPNAGAAAEALGVSKMTVLGAIREGKPDRVGLGRSLMQVTIRGVTYRSAAEAAEALGVATATVYCALTRGDIDRVGIGVDYEARKTKGGLPPKPVTVAGRRFASMADLARFVGMTPRAVRNVFSRGKDKARDDLVAKVLRIIAQEEKAARKARSDNQERTVCE